jgi:DNA-binding transcriptional ArsR family regulator
MESASPSASDGHDSDLRTSPKDIRGALKALSHPLRSAMLQHLRDHGPCTATELAEVFSESSGQTSYHLRQLARFGLIEPVQGKDARERRWKPVSLMVGPTDLADPEVVQAAARETTAMALNQIELMNRWFDAFPTEPLPWREAGTVNEATAWLTSDELEALTDELQSTLSRHVTAAKQAREKDGDQGRRPVRVHLTAFPIQPAQDPTN